MTSRRQQAQPAFLADDARRLLAAVREGPRCNLSQARARTGLGRHVFAAALDALVEAGLVHRLATSCGVLLLPDRPGIGECLNQVKALCDPNVRRLHRFLHCHDLVPNQDILGHAKKTWDWDAEATRWRLRLLETAELAQAVTDLKDPRRITYRGLPAHPLVHEVLAADA